MTGTRYTADPAAGRQPGDIIGGAYKTLPVIMCCTVGERWCGRNWIANKEEQILVIAAQKREHEATCKGGLIVVGSGR